MKIKGPCRALWQGYNCASGLSKHRLCVVDIVSSHSAIVFKVAHSCCHCIQRSAFFDTADLQTSSSSSSSFHLVMHLTHLLRRGAMSGERYGCNGWIPHTHGSMNIYGSEGPFSLSRPLGLHSLDTGTLISMVQASGNPTSVEAHGLPPHHCVRQNIEIETLCCAFTRLLTKHLMVPDDCISYMWGHVRQTSCDKVVIVAVIFNSIQEEVIDKMTTIAEGFAAPLKCFICASPCEDADAPNSTHSREENCLECEPCYLCEYCRFSMADGSPKCLFCCGQRDRCYIQEMYPGCELRVRMLTAYLDI